MTRAQTYGDRLLKETLSGIEKRAMASSREKGIQNGKIVERYLKLKSGGDVRPESIAPSNREISFNNSGTFNRKQEVKRSGTIGGEVAPNRGSIISGISAISNNARIEKAKTSRNPAAPGSVPRTAW